MKTIFKSEWQKRYTLAVVGFCGTALMYSLRFNLSIGIVAMVNHSSLHQETGTKQNNISFINHQGHNNGICPNLVEVDADSNNSFLADSPHNSDVILFKWNEKDQGLILGSFFWGYIVTQFPGGIIAQRFGAKWVIGFGLLFTGILSLILPWAAVIGGKDLVLVVRILQGLSEGFIFPAFTVLLAKWTTPNDRASLSTLCFSGMAFGTSMTMIISGHLISAFGWPAVFYVPGILTIVWFVCWSLLVFSSPQEHPTISQTELNFFEDNKESSNEKPLGFFDIPWKSIFCSVPFLAIFITHFANTWGHNTLKAEGPKYLHSVLHFDIHSNAYIAATPYIAQVIFCNAVIRFSDYLISKKIISIGTSRRVCNTIGQVGTAAAYLSLILADCNRPIAIVCYMLAGMLNGAVYGGMVINPMDLSPNYAGVLEGMINGVSNIAGFLAPFVAGVILHNEPTIAGWHYVFLIPVIADIVGNLFFVIFCSTKVQPWNEPKTSKKDSLEVK